MDFYLATRWGNKKEFRDVQKKLCDRGHAVNVDWTLHKQVKPYEQHREQSRKNSIEDIEGARNCDVFVLISDKAGTGMYVELGAAIASHIENGAPEVYVIGENTERSMFYFHPAVNRRKSIDEVLDDIDSHNDKNV